MKIMHLPRAEYIFIVSNAGMLVTYAIHFSEKQDKDYLDGLKLAAALLFLVPAPFKMFRLIPEEMEFRLTLVATAVFCITFISVVLFNFQKETDRRISGSLVLLKALKTLLPNPHTSLCTSTLQSHCATSRRGFGAHG